VVTEAQYQIKIYILYL